MDDLGVCTEATIDSISVSRDGMTITLGLTKLEKKYILSLNSVVAFVANEFRQQNVIDQINVWSSLSTSESFQETLALLLTGTSDKEKWAALSESLKRGTDAILAGDNVMLEIEAVYGVAATALVESYSLVQMHS
jgi:hypothetical protein